MTTANTNIKRKRYNTIKRQNEATQAYNQLQMWKLFLASTTIALTAIIFQHLAVPVLAQNSETTTPSVTYPKPTTTPQCASYLIPNTNKLQPNETIEQLIRRIATEKNFQFPDYLVRLANCESRLNPKAINKHNNNPSHSIDRGLFQINNYYHPSITDAQAYDPTFATIWTIDKINKGGQGIWVCDKYVKANPNKYNPK